MTQDDGDGWSSPTRSVTAARDADFDVDYAQRGVASFGGGGTTGPSAGERARTFVRRYGWRAYALPVLLIVTIAALVSATGSRAPAPHKPSANQPPATAPAQSTATTSTPPVAPSSIAVKSDGTSGASQTAPKGADLPAGAPYTMKGTGTFRVIPGTSKIYGTTGQLFRYDVEIENGITGVDATAFANLVQATLGNPKSWSGHGVRLQRVPQAQADFRVTLTSSLTVRKYCGYDIPVETSCYVQAGSVPVADVNRVVFNVSRWVRGSAAYVGDLAAYRLYMINHEVGHALGHNHAHQCLPGGLAPVMMQQTYGLKSAATGKYCQANPWPFPPGVAGAPGAEQPDTPQNSEYGLD